MNLEDEGDVPEVTDSCFAVAIHDILRGDGASIEQSGILDTTAESECLQFLVDVTFS